VRKPRPCCSPALAGSQCRRRRGRPYPRPQRPRDGRTHPRTGRGRRIQAIRASELPALREAEARAAAGLQRLTNARETLDREEERAKERVAELDRRLMQFSADIAREQQQSSDAEVALQGSRPKTAS